MIFFVNSDVAESGSPPNLNFVFSGLAASRRGSVTNISPSSLRTGSAITSDDSDRRKELAWSALATSSCLSRILVSARASQSTDALRASCSDVDSI